MSNVIQFPHLPRITTGNRIQQVIDRAHELRDIPQIVAAAGFAVGDTVQHVTYQWQGVIIAFDWLAGIAVHCMVEVTFGARGRRVIPIHVDLLRLAAKAGTA